MRLPGFAVPLSSDYRNVDELLFVPNQLACIHVPAPPPHLVVFTRLREGVHVNKLNGAFWLEGILQLKPTQSIYGAAAWEIIGGELSTYEWSKK